MLLLLQFYFLWLSDARKRLFFLRNIKCHDIYSVIKFKLTSVKCKKHDYLFLLVENRIFRWKTSMFVSQNFVKDFERISRSFLIGKFNVVLGHFLKLHLKQQTNSFGNEMSIILINTNRRCFTYTHTNTFVTVFGYSIPP